MKGKTDRLELQLTARSRSATVARRTIADNEENEENEEHDEDAHLDGSVRYDLLVSADTPMQKLHGYGKIMCEEYAIELCFRPVWHAPVRGFLVHLKASDRGRPLCSRWQCRLWWRMGAAAAAAGSSTRWARGSAV